MFAMVGLCGSPIPDELVLLDAVPCYDTARNEYLSKWLQQRLARGRDGRLLFLAFSRGASPGYSQAALDTARKVLGAKGEPPDTFSQRFAGYVSEAEHGKISSLFGPVAFGGAAPPPRATPLTMVLGGPQPAQIAVACRPIGLQRDIEGCR